MPISFPYITSLRFSPHSPLRLSAFRPMMKVFFWVVAVVGFVLRLSAHGFEGWNESNLASLYYGAVADPLLVPLTLIPSAASKGAVCSDGTLPGYHLHRGYGSGANSWLVNLEGGGWCNNIRTCVYRKTTRRGSSNYMEKQIQFTGIMSNKPEENPDFFNWNRVKVRYCDGASFLGEGYDKASGLFFRGQRIWLAAMEDLMSKGMHYANQALLSGCSAGVLHPYNIVMSSSVDVAGGRTLRSFFQGTVSLQGVANSLSKICTSRMDATSCFFPQNVAGHIQTPLFLLNTAYDVWQLQQSLAPNQADPHGYWKACKLNHSNCDANQIEFLQGFRNEMLNAVKGSSMSRQNGLFINSCFAHCQTERQDTWYGNNSPYIGNKGIAKSVGDWYFDRSEVKTIDCPYPCDKSCHDLVFRNSH